MQIFDAIAGFVQSGPVAFVYLFFLFGAFSRSQAIYWIGRYMGSFVMRRGRPDGGWRLRVYDKIHADSTRRTIAVLRRRGWPMIPVSFLTVGLQTLIQLSAGVIAMPWLRYFVASIPGALAWALIYTTIGWAVWAATFRAATGSPWALLALLVLVAGIVLWRRTHNEPAAHAAID